MNPNTNGGILMELTIDRLTKHYGSHIGIDRLSLTLTPGIYGLLGPNGSGKTTLMRMLCSILKPTSGDITFNGLDVTSENYRNLLGYLPQDFGYYPNFSGRRFLLYMAALKGLSTSLAKAKIKELLKLVSLEDAADRKIKTYSGGMKQRLGIAQALLNNPKLLILDEPTAGLDPKERVRFRNLISDLGTDRIILLSTHIVSDLEYIADTILLLKKGQLLHRGNQETILDPIQGNVYECHIKEKELDTLLPQLTLINIRHHKDSLFIRYAAPTSLLEDAVVVTPTLEDLYLYYFNEEALYA